MSAKSRSHEDVVEELKRLARRTISGAFQAGLGLLEITDLYEITQRVLPEVWQVDQTKALTQILQVASDQLPNKAIVDGAKMTWVEFAYRLYNLEGDDLSHVDRKKYDYLLSEAFEQAELSFYSESHRKRITLKVRKQLARILLEMEANLDSAAGPDSLSTHAVEGPRKQVAGYTDLSPVLKPSVSSELARRTWRERLPYWSNDYVRRKDYHDTIKRLTAENKLIALVGLPGFGKSRLARELAAEMAEENQAEVIWLRGDSWTTVLVDINSVLSERSIPILREENQLVREFTSLLASSTPRLIVVIDDLNDPTLVQRILPLNVSAIVFATMRQKLLDEDGWAYVVIDGMSLEEAATLARAQLPSSVNDQEVTQLVKVLAGYPLAILHAAVLVGKSASLNISYLCDEIERDAARVFDIKARRERTLTFIYKALLARLEQEHKQAAELLVMAAVLRQGQLSRQLLREIFETIPRYRQEVPADEYDYLGFISSVETLEDYVLIASSGEDLLVHHLVKALIRALKHDSDGYIEEAIVALLNTRMRRTPTDLDEMSTWRSTVLALIENARARSLDANSSIQLGELLTAVVGATVATGDRKALSDLKHNWLFQLLSTGSGAQDRTIAYLQYNLLSLADGEYEPLALVALNKQADCYGPVTFDRKSTIVDHREDSSRIHNDVLSLPEQRSGSLRLIEPLASKLQIARQALSSGRLSDTRKHASTALRDATDPRSRIMAHIVLTRLELRQLDLNQAKHHLQKVREEITDMDSDSSRHSATANSIHYLSAAGQVNQLAGDIEHLEFVIDKGSAGITRKHYEAARDNYWHEAISVNRYEIERKLNCTLAHSAPQRAETRLRTLLGQTEVPLHLPVHHRTQVSLTKLAILRRNVTTEDIDRCWRAAEFYNTSQIRDRYWYTEALFTAYLAGLVTEEAESEQALLYGAIIREAQAIGRNDKIEFMLAANYNNGVKFARLLAD